LNQFQYDYIKKQGGTKEMKILLGGIVAMIIGVVGLIVWWVDFLEVLKGVIPIILVLGGALAIYLGIEDVKTSASSKEEETKKESTE
jgi:threonine/homoserine/homoserine lactone efflux protein